MSDDRIIDYIDIDIHNDPLRLEKFEVFPDGDPEDDAGNPRPLTFETYVSEIEKEIKKHHGLPGFIREWELQGDLTMTVSHRGHSVTFDMHGNQRTGQ